jgi:hypothetical protein
MATLKHGLIAMVATFALSGVCRGGVSAVLLIYQPIITSGEATVIETPKGFSILAIPFECFHYHGRPPFYAIAQPNPILTDAPRSALPRDSNLVSSAGITIGSSIDDDIVHVHFESLHTSAALNVTVDDIAEATLECIRRTAEGTTAHPKVKITGKKGDEAKWKRWQDSFEKHDLTKPFIRPNA